VVVEAEELRPEEVIPMAVFELVDELEMEETDWIVLPEQ
jgi:hypothetical protein